MSRDLSGASSALTPERLQLFMTSLSGMAEDEVRKAKLLLLRNEISELKASLEENSATKIGMFMSYIIPFGWPIAYAEHKKMKVRVTLQKERIRNALNVWASDLGQEGKLLESELNLIAV